MQRLVGLMRRCAEDYKMIQPGDRIGIGVSGGKDSLALLVLMSELRRHCGFDFYLEAVTVDLGFGMDFAPIQKLCDDLGIPLTVVKTEISKIIFDYRQEKNPCSMCAKMRRGAINQALLDRGLNKLALGHHFVDAVETFVMNLIYEGRIGCFQPVTELDRTGIVQIRPMLYIHEKTVEAFAERMELPIVQNRCPVDKRTKREEIKGLVYDLSARYPDLKERVFGAMQRLPLPEWEPQGRYNRPKDE